ncbi:MAG TPA: EF-hand domain-containing protein [Asticcacaulis sp.]|nr:EF-hand domain-containing protein [Asticcacaulis sp.]
MRLPLISLAALAVLTLPAAAQDYLATGMGQQVFFSPSGQPFRAAPGKPYPTMDWFNAADADHDGKISHDEFVADAMRFFDALDLNHDGYINSPENTRYENQVAPEIQLMDPRIQQPKVIQHDYDADMDANQDQEPNGGKYIKQIVGASQYGLIDEPQPIRAADANFDFRVSKDEWLAASNQRFAILDRNRDGFITANELPQTPAQVAQELDQKDGKDRRNKKKHSGFW